MRLVAVAPGVQDLQGDFAALPMHRIRHQTMLRKLAGITQHRTAFHAHAGKCRCDAPGDNQCHAVTRPFSIESRQTFCTLRMFFQPGVHRPHQDAVFKGSEAQIQRGKQ